MQIGDGQMKMIWYECTSMFESSASKEFQNEGKD